MGAVGLVARAELRRRRVSLVVLAVLTAVVVATVLATLAGANRTATALDRFMDATAARDLQVVVNSADFAREPTSRGRPPATPGRDGWRGRRRHDDDHSHRHFRYAVRLRRHGQS